MMGAARTKQTARKRKTPPNPRDRVSRERWIQEHKEEVEEKKKRDQERKREEARNALIAAGIENPSYLDISRKVMEIEGIERAAMKENIRKVNEIARDAEDRLPELISKLEEREHILNTAKLDMYKGTEELYTNNKYKYALVERDGVDDDMDIFPTIQEQADYNEQEEEESKKLNGFKQYCYSISLEEEKIISIVNEIAAKMGFDDVEDMLIVIYDMDSLKEMINKRLGIAAVQADQEQRWNFVPRPQPVPVFAY